MIYVNRQHKEVNLSELIRQCELMPLLGDEVGTFQFSNGINSLIKFYDLLNDHFICGSCALSSMDDHLFSKSYRGFDYHGIPIVQYFQFVRIGEKALHSKNGNIATWLSLSVNHFSAIWDQYCAYRLEEAM